MSKLIDRFRSPRGLRSHLFSITITFSLIFAVLGILLNHFFTSKLYFIYAKDTMMNMAEEITTYDLWNTGFYNDIAQLESLNDVYIEIYLLPETTIYTTRANDYLYGDTNYEDSYLISKPLRTIGEPVINDDGSYFDIKQELNGTAKYLVYNKSDVNEYFALRISMSYNAIESNGTLATNFINILIALMFVIITSFLIIYENFFIKPLISINSVTKKIADLDFDVKCSESGIKEINELGKSINHLSTALDMSLTDLQEKNRQLENDIQKEQRLDKARTEFISNASHELKTPISIIQGYAEGLKIGIADGEYAEEYCDIIMEETQKMNALVLKLLEICHYESGAYKLSCQRFNISFVANSLLKPRIKLLKEQGITLCLNINPQYIGYGDISSIDTVINNYVSNAVSHVSEPGLIIVNCCPVNGKYRLSVYNTGDRIAEDDIDKIWESFYRADKARSRASGRFGLGLSFVKSIQELHNNDYGVINRENGVEFWFDINKAKCFYSEDTE